MKVIAMLTHRLALLLLVLLLAGAFVSCADDDDDDNQPAPTATELLVGDGNKRWYFSQTGEVSFGLDASAEDIANATVPLTAEDACNQDDGIEFKIDGTLHYWSGQITCGQYDTLVNVLSHDGETWELQANDTQLQTTGSNANISQIKELTASRLHVRNTATYRDSIYVSESVLVTR